MTASPAGPVEGVATPRSLTRSLLIVLLAISGLLAATVVALFLLPPPHLKVPDIEFVVRVARVEDFPVGTGRTVTSGERSVLVVRREQDAYFAVEGTASSDGCFLHWNPDALRIESPCTYVVYDLDGNVVEGLTRVPLRRYRVFERDGVLYIAES